MNKNNTTPKSEYIAKLEAMYKEHWNHARHCEEQIFWFTNIYAVVVAAIFYFIAETNKSPNTDFGPSLVLVFFGLVLSVIGFFIVVSQSLGHRNYIMNIVTICYYWDVLEFYADPKKPVYYKVTHRWLFEITIALFAVLCIAFGYLALTHNRLSCEYWILLIAISVFFSFFIDRLYQERWRRYSRERGDFISALRNDTEGVYRSDWNKWFKDPEFWKEIIENARKEKTLELHEECWIVGLLSRICRGPIRICEKLYWALCRKTRKNKVNQDT